MGNDSECLDHPQALRCGGSEPPALAGRAIRNKGLGWPDALRLPLWQAILAVLAILSLLLAFHQVVLGAVQQGELRRKATAMQAGAAWRCNVIPVARSRDDCLMRLNATLPVREGPTEANVAFLGR